MAFLAALPWVATAISGLAGAGASIYNTYQQKKNNQANISAQERANAQNQANTEENWRREDTAYQRKVKDMAAAGLNPQLAAEGAGLSTSPAIRNDPVMSDAPQIDSGAMMGAVMQLADIKQRQADLENTNARTDLTRADVSKTMAQTSLSTHELLNSVRNARWDVEDRPFKRNMVIQNDKMLGETINQAQHNLKYAIEHDLPVGQSDVMIRRFEYLIDKLMSLRESMSNSGVFGNLKSAFGTAGGSLNTFMFGDTQSRKSLLNPYGLGPTEFTEWLGNQIHRDESKKDTRWNLKDYKMY